LVGDPPVDASIRTQKVRPGNQGWDARIDATESEAGRLGYPWPMNPKKRVRLVTLALASSLALGLAACGEDDAERNVEERVKQAREAGRDAKKAGQEAAREAKKAGEDAANKAEKGAKETERKLQE
jgi:hypothetical protein